MALIRCHECGKSVSTTAAACPTCGAPPVGQAAKQSSDGSIVKRALIAIVLGSVAVWYVNSIYQRAADVNKPEPSPETRAALARAEEDKKRGDAKVTAVVNGAIKLRAAAHDRKGFELDDATVTSDGAGCYEFRARNAFNGVRKGKAVLTPGGALIASEDGGAFVKAWNKLCAGQSGQNLTAISRDYFR